VLCNPFQGNRYGITFPLQRIRTQLLLLETVFSTRSVQSGYKEANWGNRVQLKVGSQFCTGLLTEGPECGKMNNHHCLTSIVGRAIAQAASRWLPTAAAGGSNPGLVMWDFVVDKVALGQVFSEYFGFPCHSSFHQLLQKSSSSIIWGLYNRPEVAAVPRDLSRT
jgi:hypothetical protein